MTSEPIHLAIAFIFGMIYAVVRDFFGARRAPNQGAEKEQS